MRQKRQHAGIAHTTFLHLIKADHQCCVVLIMVFGILRNAYVKGAQENRLI